MSNARILQRIDNHLRPKLKHRDRATRRFAATALRLAMPQRITPQLRNIRVKEQLQLPALVF